MKTSLYLKQYIILYTELEAPDYKRIAAHLAMITILHGEPMGSTNLRKCFECITYQTYARSSHKSVKDTAVGWHASTPFQEYSNDVKRDLN